jgi:hypothetical protein
MASTVRRSPAVRGGNGWQDELPPSQLTLSFEPSLPERFKSLREFVAFRVQEQRLHAATLASRMDLSPSVLSRKLNQPEAESHRLNCDDLEAYIAASGDLMPVIEYLASKFSPGGDAARKARVLSRVESLAVELERAMATLREGA